MGEVLGDRDPATPSAAEPAPDAQATACATWADEWRRAGVRHAIIAPGSRSTPLAVALTQAGDIEVHVHHDERSAAFMALGVGRASGAPAVVVTTSGTAATEVHPAVVEAHQDRVPMVVCTADRPPELRDVAAPQTIEQHGLYGAAVRWSFDPGVPEWATAATWRSVAARAVASATGDPPGPVHLNQAFREPLSGRVGELPAGRSDDRPWHVRPARGVHDPDAVALVIEAVSGRRGVILADRGAPPSTLRLAGALGWPVLAGPRAPLPGPRVITSGDSILRHGPSAAELAPEVVIRLGDPLASRVLNEWAARAPCQLQLGGAPWSDPAHTADVLVPAPRLDLLVDELARDVPAAADPDWLEGWLVTERAARRAIVGHLDDHPETEPAIARAVMEESPQGASVVLSSSMPIRDVEWYGGRRRADLVVHANRGANGIDGVVSTAVGVAIGQDAPTVALVGDVAALHDTNGLLGLADRAVDLTMVVIDNDGGGIFSFLPQAAVLAPETFERLFATPHGVDLAALARVHGLDAEVLPDADALRHRLSGPTTGAPRVLVVRTDRAANVVAHRAIESAVAAALDGVWRVPGE